MSQWKTNSPVIILLIYSAVLLSVQISNSQYHCFSNDLVFCKNYLTADDAKCQGPGMFKGQISDQSAKVSVYCPWKDWESIKVFALLLLILIIGNWYITRLILKLYNKILLCVISLSIIAPLILISGIIDLVNVSASTCPSNLIQVFSVNDECRKGWFYINALLEIFCSIVIGIACFSMFKWRKRAKLEQNREEEIKYSLVYKEDD